MGHAEIRHLAAGTPQEWARLCALFRRYAQGLSVDLAYQDFDTELMEVAVRYAPPSGGAWIASAGDEDVGCIALRTIEPSVAEMKRLYVAPSARGQQLGRRLALAAVEEARALGCRCLRLDTLADMEAAQGLYRSLGFMPIAPYYPSPVAGTTFMELAL